MNTGVIFKGEWIRESMASKKSNGNSWWDLTGFGDIAGEDTSGLFPILLAVGFILVLIALFVRLILKRRDAIPVAQHRTVMTADSIHFTANDEPVESFQVREISEICILQETDAGNLLNDSDVLPATNFIELTLTDKRLHRYSFSVGSLFMNTQLHKVIQAWRQRIATVTHFETVRCSRRGFDKCRSMCDPSYR